MCTDRLNVLILGSLGPNPERVLALLPFLGRITYVYTQFNPFIPHLQHGGIQCVAALPNEARQTIRVIEEQPVDIVYSLLNAHDGSTEATLQLLDDRCQIPMVRHYKEHPCVPTHEERRVLLETRAQIYINEESREYFVNTYGANRTTSHVMDADQISRVFMTGDIVPKLRLTDGEPHVLIAGGVSILGDRLDMREFCAQMAGYRVHTHIYGYPRGLTDDGMPIVPHLETALEYRRLAASTPYIHLHDYVSPREFVKEWSRYDAGMMHASVPGTHSEAAFQRLNLAHRYSAYLAAGLPLLVHHGGQDAMARLVRAEQIGCVFESNEHARSWLYNEQILTDTTANVLRSRERFSFEANVEALVDLFRAYALR
jgi:hypothetical protein